MKFRLQEVTPMLRRLSDEREAMFCQAILISAGELELRRLRLPRMAASRQKAEVSWIIGCGCRCVDCLRLTIWACGRRSRAGTVQGEDARHHSSFTIGHESP